MADTIAFAFISNTSLYFIIPHRRYNVNIFQNWILIEYEYMGPKLAPAEGVIGLFNCKNQLKSILCFVILNMGNAIR